MLSNSLIERCIRTRAQHSGSEHTSPGVSTIGSEEAAFERLSDFVRQASMQSAAVTAPLVRELTGTNVFAAAHVCQRRGSKTFYQRFRNVSVERQDQCASTLHRCNMHTSFQIVRDARMWDTEHHAVLPCTTTRNLSDRPDKYCNHVRDSVRSFPHLALTTHRRLSLPTVLA